MTRITVQGYIYEVSWGSSSDKEYRVSSSEKMEDRWYTLIGPVSIDYEIPPEFNSVARQLANIEAEKAKVRAAYQAKVAELNEQASKPQAIEYVEAA